MTLTKCTGMAGGTARGGLHWLRQGIFSLLAVDEAYRLAEF